MHKIKLTRRNIDQIELVPSGQHIYRDTELSGFGLRVGKQSKSFFVERQVGRKTFRRTIGTFPVVTRELAREKALGVLRQIAAGEDPLHAKRRKPIGTLTLDEAGQDFFAGRPHLKAITRETYQRSLDLHLADWKHKPITAITRQMTANWSSVLPLHQRSRDRRRGTLRPSIAG